jgi:hypothetical protein
MEELQDDIAGLIQQYIDEESLTIEAQVAKKHQQLMLRVMTRVFDQLIAFEIESEARSQLHHIVQAKVADRLAEYDTQLKTADMQALFDDQVSQNIQAEARKMFRAVFTRSMLSAGIKKDMLDAIIMAAESFKE